MTDKEALANCLEAFARGEYATCVWQAARRFPHRVNHPILQLLSISLQRLDCLPALERLAPQLLDATTSRPWEQALLLLTLGQLTVSEVLARSRDAVERCQAHYYCGERLLTLGCFAAAQEAFDAALATGADCLEHRLARVERCHPAPASLNPAASTSAAGLP